MGTPHGYLGRRHEYSSARTAQIDDLKQYILAIKAKESDDSRLVQLYLPIFQPGSMVWREILCLRSRKYCPYEHLNSRRSETRAPPRRRPYQPNFIASVDYIQLGCRLRCS